MFASRGIILSRLITSSIARKTINSNLPKNTRLSSSSTWSYRVGAPYNKTKNIMADCVGAVMFWWILWHVYHEYGHIIGEFDYPDASTWTNAELGIPPDDYEE